MKIWMILTLSLFLAVPLAQAVGEPEQQATAAEKAKEVSYDISSIFGTVATNDATARRDPKFSEFLPGIFRYEDASGIVHFDDGKALRMGEVVLITGARPPFYEILINGKPYFIQQSKVSLPASDKTRLDEMPANVAVAFKKNAMLHSLNDRLKQLDGVKKAIEKTSKQGGLTLLRNKIYRSSKYTDSTGFTVSVSNPTKKTIKYVSFTVVGYNRVNDPVSGGKNRGTSITVKGVGPIEPNRSASYDWEHMWLTDLVQTHKITSIKVEYTDGGKRTINNIKAITLASEHISAMNE